jgi:hypothetical protein
LVEPSLSANFGTSDGGLEIWNLPQINAQLAEIGLNW